MVIPLTNIQRYEIVIGVIMLFKHVYVTGKKKVRMREENSNRKVT